jgi:hypothetical protein
MYILRLKKAILPFLESLKEAKLIQGNTVTLIRNIKSRENTEILLNFKIQSDSGPMRLIGRYRGEENFINVFKMFLLVH